MSNEIKIKCGDCGQVNTTSYSDMHYDEETDQGGMGIKREFWGSVEIECSKCGKELKITHNYTEYPVGNIEDGATESKDGTIL